MVEYYTTVTALGIRFWDMTLDRQVSDNLVVKAYPVLGTGPVVSAFRSASGIYGFQGLPGMQAIELKKSDNEGIGVPGSPPFMKSFYIEVTDKLNRFLPVIFTVELPLPYPVYLSDDPVFSGGSPGSGNPPGFYLFSSPSRTVSPGLAAIHAALVEQATGRPAAYAVLQVDVQGAGGENVGILYGIADERGCISILFPYPDMEVSLSGSPPPNSPDSLEQQEWQLTLQVRYEPGELKTPDNINIEPKIPLLKEIFNQKEGKIWTKKPADEPDENLSTVLTFGEPLILRTKGVEKSELWIDQI